jgi:hypothetical protein
MPYIYPLVFVNSEKKIFQVFTLYIYKGKLSPLGQGIFNTKGITKTTLVEDP